MTRRHKFRDEWRHALTGEGDEVGAGEGAGVTAVVGRRPEGEVQLPIERERGGGEVELGSGLGLGLGSGVGLGLRVGLPEYPP